MASLEISAERYEAHIPVTDFMYTLEWCLFCFRELANFLIIYLFNPILRFSDLNAKKCISRCSHKDSDSARCYIVDYFVRNNDNNNKFVNYILYIALINIKGN